MQKIILTNGSTLNVTNVNNGEDLTTALISFEELKKAGANPFRNKPVKLSFTRGGVITFYIAQLFPQLKGAKLA